MGLLQGLRWQEELGYAIHGCLQQIHLETPADDYVSLQNVYMKQDRPFQLLRRGFRSFNMISNIKIELTVLIFLLHLHTRFVCHLGVSLNAHFRGCTVYEAYIAADVLINTPTQVCPAK